MELGRRSRERPAGGGAHFGPALLEGGGAQLQAPLRGPGWPHLRLWSSQWEAEVRGVGGEGLKQEWY